MGKFNRYQSDRERYGKCEVCRQYLSIESYFCEGDQIICNECGTKHTLQSLETATLAIVDNLSLSIDETFDVSKKTRKKTGVPNSI